MACVIRATLPSTRASGPETAIMRRKYRTRDISKLRTIRASSRPHSLRIAIFTTLRIRVNLTAVLVMALMLFFGQSNATVFLTMFRGLILHSADSSPSESTTLSIPSSTLLPFTSGNPSNRDRSPRSADSPSTRPIAQSSVQPVGHCSHSSTTDCARRASPSKFKKPPLNPAASIPSSAVVPPASGNSSNRDRSPRSADIPSTDPIAQSSLKPICHCLESSMADCTPQPSRRTSKNTLPKPAASAARSC